ncbi:efflux RND transporter periplasmic adaptor subunit [Phaeobacter gallaeciensis]|uniref:efflux RND transporter periplasmic adaptor subunit n=1 Tax=Phaeobacter gallaeciensis TaxID=60890 RepID=UPI00237F0F7C|nr:efflux RND transporter periplasmic adaptor subunit [Phaeobacter gallaeciensis]MDE4302164.1 efflux RND transporter periplasmic adaptor subunit [Phaeobacter gallaeciensis]MDE4306859.1 efflux RND transporter periplasmic adaptor subunit [Phaeobacter gallaeciensis]MDE4311022.1 efflux RND transporter periplasmic adaptor subunit [Phaeobacter gallaeciensis]MDE4315485.1 efflux RND transporter periplasmic adaptor subunit [Phaeobacter gallaeciensis]MDE4319949.1 efflux RND transporter periplasmic adapt
MRFLRHSLTGLFLTAAMLGLLLYAGWLVMGAVQARLNAEPRTPPARERIFAVRVVSADVQTIAPVLIAFGRIDSRRTLELRTALAGRVIHLSENFEEGGRVEEGALLVQIDPADAQAALDRAEADMMDARAEERDAGRALILANDELEAAQDQAELRGKAYQRQLDLEERGVGTTATVETAALAAAQARQAVISRRQAISQAEARVDQAKTRVARAEIALETAQRDLADTSISAAFSGTLQAVSLVEGRLISANEKLAELVDADRLEVAFRVSTLQYARLLDDAGHLIEAPVRVMLDAAGAALSATGQLSRVSGAAGDGQTGRLVYARLDAAPGFKPGDFVTVSVTEPPVENVVRVPASALGSDGQVLVLGAEDRLEALPVELVRRQGDAVLIRGEGLAGREIVTGRTPLLGAGIRVRPLRIDAKAEIAPEAAGPELIELTEDRRARLVALVEGNARMPEEARKRVLAQLSETAVPAQLVNRIEARKGG